MHIHISYNKENLTLHMYTYSALKCRNFVRMVINHDGPLRDSLASSKLLISSCLGQGDIVFKTTMFDFNEQRYFFITIPSLRYPWVKVRVYC